MRWRWLLLLLLAAVVAAPFAMRPRGGPAAAADDAVVIVTPHSEAVRQEFSRGFAEWYRRRTGRAVRIDWRIIGGTGDISRFLESAYAAAFEREWAGRRGMPWSAAVRAGFQQPWATEGPLGQAREAFLASDVSCGIDVFFGGDAYQFSRDAVAGRMVDAGLRALHPDWFGPDAIPQTFRGQTFWDEHGRWYGVVLSSYGIISNRDSGTRLGVPPPRHWRDLANPAYQGELALADPTKSGSVCEAFETIVQDSMHRRFSALQAEGAGEEPSAREQRAVREGWVAGMRLIQQLGANARYFTDASQKPPIDVANGDCAVGLCIDFYGRQQQEAVRIRGDARRVAFITPEAGSSVSADPIGLLRGAPNRPVAVAFLEYVLSPEGQALWAFKAGAPGGPVRYALRRMPIRRDFYQRRDWDQHRSDPADAPYDAASAFVYRIDWTGRLFREIGFITRAMCLETHAELTEAWRAIQAAPEPARSNALAVLQDMSAVSYERAGGEIHARLNARDRVQEVTLATELTRAFRENYVRAARIARGEL